MKNEEQEPELVSAPPAVVSRSPTWRWTWIPRSADGRSSSARPESWSSTMISVALLSHAPSRRTAGRGPRA